MKRSKNIDLNRMARYAGGRQAMKPLALAVLSISAMSCGTNRSEETAEIYINPAECVAANPDREAECAAAYREALAQAAATGPKYQSLEDCVAEFGERNCVPYEQAAAAAPEAAPPPPPGQSWFMPALAGYMFGRMMGGGFQTAPMYTSFNRASPAYGQWAGADGRSYGSAAQRRVRVDADTFRPKPTVSRTISRGGFGSTVAARSNWGGKGATGGGRSGWGG